MSILPLCSEQLKEQFPIMREYSYFNTAAYGVVPAVTSLAMVNYWTTSAAYPNDLGKEGGDGRERLESKVARLIGASPSEIAFTGSTSEATNIGATALPLGKGDEVLIPANEFPSVSYPVVYQASRRGFSVKYIDWEGNGPTAETIEAAFTERTRALFMSWVQYQNGYTHDLERIGRICREHDAYLVVDAIQGLGVVPLDVKKAGVHILGAGTYKWLMAEAGFGVMYIAADTLPRMAPAAISHAGIIRDQGDRLRVSLKNDISKFAMGGNNLASMHALSSSLDLIESIGVLRINDYVKAFSVRIWDALKTRGYHVRSDREQLSPIVTFTTGNKSEDERILGRLAEHNVVTSIRPFGIRLSPYIYCTTEDVDKLLSLL